MANTYELISSVTVGAGGASTIDFTSIPSTYTDLVVKISARSNTATLEGNVIYKFNGSTTGLSTRFLEGSGSAASSTTLSYNYAGAVPASNSTANTFSNNEIYIPNYLSSVNKSSSADGTMETNGTTSYSELTANLWSNTAAINQVTVYLISGNFVQYSTAYLYGVKNA